MNNMFEQLDEATDSTDGHDRLRIRGDDDEASPDPSQLFQQQQTPDIGYYECSWCPFKHQSERTVRAHITREEEGNHKNKNGFIDDIFIKAYTDDGEFIGDMESPKTMTFPDEVTESDLPDDVDMDSKAGKILKVAIENPNMERSDVAHEVYDNPMSGGNSYTHRVLDKYLSADAARDAEADEETPSDQSATPASRRGMTAGPSDAPTHKPSAEKSYDDLEPAQKVIINEYIRNPDRPMAEIERLAGVSAGYGQRVLDKYPHIVETRSEQYAQGDLEPPAPEDILDDAEGAEKTYDELTPLQQRVIDHWVKDPEQHKRDIENKAGASPGYSARLFRKYGDIRDARREAFEQGILTEDDLNTPPRSAFIKDTSVPRDEQEKLPEEDQPTGVSIEDAQSDIAAMGVGAGATQAQLADFREEFASTEALEEVREDVVALEESMATRLDHTTSRLDSLEDALEDSTAASTERAVTDDQLAEVEARLDELETEVATTAGSDDSTHAPELSTGETDDGLRRVELEPDQWTTVVRALTKHLPEDQNDLLQDIVVQA